MCCLLAVPPACGLLAGVVERHVQIEPLRLAAAFVGAVGCCCVDCVRPAARRIFDTAGSENVYVLTISCSRGSMPPPSCAKADCRSAKSFASRKTCKLSSPPLYRASSLARADNEEAEDFEEEEEEEEAASSSAAFFASSADTMIPSREAKVSQWRLPGAARHVSVKTWNSTLAAFCSTTSPLAWTLTRVNSKNLSSLRVRERAAVTRRRASAKA